MNTWKCVFYAAVLILLAGCAHHSFRIEPDGVHLFLRIPDAQRVSVASSLDGFTLHEAVQAGRSTWEVVLPGGKEFTYFYIVDGKVYLPECLYRECDGYGSYNCVYIPGM
ncbi:MAG: hypothetical protein ACP5G0_10970 [Desulfomonilia bacterium]